MESKEKELPYDQGPAEETLPEGPRNWKERQYEKLRGKVSVKALDILIGLLIAAIAAVLIIGVATGKR